MKLIIFLLTLFFTQSIYAGTPVPSPDRDGDGFNDYSECTAEDDGLECKGVLDKCVDGPTCIYDLDNSGPVITTADYGVLVEKINSFQRSCAFEDGTYRNVRWCFVDVGDYTGGLTYPGNVEVLRDYKLTNSDICKFLKVNLAVWEVLEPNLPVTTCLRWR